MIKGLLGNRTGSCDCKDDYCNGKLMRHGELRYANVPSTFEAIEESTENAVTPPRMNAEKFDGGDFSEIQNACRGRSLL